MSRPWMPLYVADYLADTGYLSTIEHGAYLLLIMHYWQNGALPADETKLARICRLVPREWATVRETLADFFEPGWRHARIERELCSAREAYERRAKAGRKGGAASGKPKPGSSNASASEGSNAEASGPSNAEAPPKQSQSQSHLQKDPSRRGEVSRGETPPVTDEAPGEDLTGSGQSAAPAHQPAAWDDDAPFGRDAAAGGAR